VLADRPADVDLHDEGVPMQAGTLVLRGHVRQAMGGLEPKFLH